MEEKVKKPKRTGVEISNMVRGGMMLNSIANKLCEAILEAGGSEADIHRLSTLEGTPLIKEMAKCAVVKPAVVVPETFATLLAACNQSSLDPDFTEARWPLEPVAADDDDYEVVEHHFSEIMTIEESLSCLEDMMKRGEIRLLSGSRRAMKWVAAHQDAQLDHPVIIPLLAQDSGGCWVVLKLCRGAIDDAERALGLFSLDAGVFPHFSWLVLRKRVATVKSAPVDYFLPLADSEVPEKYQSTLLKYRKLATEHGVAAAVPVCYRIRAGFTLKKYISEVGSSHSQFNYLSTWDFPDEATSDCLVFWVPRILDGSTDKTTDQSIKLLAELRASLELPAYHLCNFGKINLVAGLIAAHHKTTGERIPLKDYWVRTDTCHAYDHRFHLCWDESSFLVCDSWDLDVIADDCVGVLVLGVEEI